MEETIQSNINLTAAVLVMRLAEYCLEHNILRFNLDYLKKLYEAHYEAEPSEPIIEELQRCVDSGLATYVKFIHGKTEDKYTKNSENTFRFKTTAVKGDNSFLF